MNDFENLKERHTAFWEMKNADAPLMSVGRYHPLQPRAPIPLADGTTATEGRRLTPDLIDHVQLAAIHGQPSSAFAGDFVHGVAPYDMCWAEVITGCPLYWMAGHVWTTPCEDDGAQYVRLRSEDGGWEHLRVAPDNVWLHKLLTLTRLLVERAQGRYPITQPLLRGPIDILTAVLGDESSCFLMKDDPKRFRRLLDVCTDNFITIMKAWMAASPPFQGGYCEYGIWAAGTVVRTQADNAALISPQDYREFLKPCDERICDAFDYPLIHTHSGVIHIMVDSLLDTEKLRAVQVSLDYPAGPPISEILPILQRINECKPLIITGGLTAKELEMLQSELSPQGLCLSVYLHDGTNGECGGQAQPINVNRKY